MSDLRYLNNDVHRTVCFTGKGSFCVWSAAPEAVRIKVAGVMTTCTRWCVWVTLYGDGWSDADVDRAERQRRYLDEKATKRDALNVRDHLANSCSEWLCPTDDLVSFYDSGLSSDDYRKKYHL